jgi:hypothetical protein
VTVASEERTGGLQIHVACQKWPGLLVAILEAVEVLGLNVLQARVSCKNYFMFDALSGEVIRLVLGFSVHNNINQNLIYMALKVIET